MNRGSEDIQRGIVSRFDASMRPRFMNRGSIDLQRQALCLDEASMRPRFMNRGSTNGDKTQFVDWLELQ